MDDLSFYQNAISKSQGKLSEVREKLGKKKVGKVAILLEAMTNGQVNNVLSPLKHSWFFFFWCQSICQGLISNS